jgi:hypothetical protein
VSDDRLIQILQYLAILLFVSAGVLPLARSRYSWGKWAKWGSIAIFGVAFLYPRGALGTGSGLLTKTGPQDCTDSGLAGVVS